MKILPALALIGVVLEAGSVCQAARCTTVPGSNVLREYEIYVDAAEPAMAIRFAGGELSWLPDDARREASAQLAAGKLIRRNISDAVLNRRIADQNGTVIDWVGAIRIRRTSLAELRAVLEDYGRYASIYWPMIFESRAEQTAASMYDVTLGLHNQFRFASLFPQHYSFRVKARMSYSDGARIGAPELRAHLRSDEIRESDSGVPGRTDFLEPYHDHGIMWALNSWWRARQQGRDLYLEFETVTLARSAQDFACKVGIIPVPRSIVSSAMDSIPAESLEIVLARTKVECERRASGPPAAASDR
jgi:hypothetical protein